MGVGVGVVDGCWGGVLGLGLVIGVGIEGGVRCGRVVRLLGLGVGVGVSVVGFGLAMVLGLGLQLGLG